MAKILENGSMLVQCEKCKNTFPLTAENAANSLHHKEEYVTNGTSIFLTYYDCPECGRRHYVQIDDKSSLDELKEVQRMFIRLSVLKRKGKAIPQKQSAKFKKAQQHLSDYRTNLMKRYTGTTLKNHDSGEDFALRFSV